MLETQSFTLSVFFGNLLGMKAMEKLFKNSTFWWLFIMISLCGLMWWRMNAHYNKILEGTKLQEHRYRPY